jgi:hypothetical protein
MESILCGDPEAAHRFYHRNRPVIDAVTNTHDLFWEMLNRAHPNLDGQEKIMIWLLGASCLREFEEIILLAGNGFGTGATKLMRSFYERTITMSYLASDTSQIPRFADYSAIHWHQLLGEAEDIHPQFTISAAARQRIVDGYEAAKAKFRDEKCPTCKRRGQTSWTKATMKEMASKVSNTIRLFCFNAYLTPTLHLHTTHWGIVNQCEISGNDKLHFSGSKVQEDAAQEAFEQAYILLTQAMDVLDQLFELGMGGLLQQHGQDWLDACKAIASGSA